MPSQFARTRLSMRLRQSPTRYEPKARIAAGGMAEVWRADAVFAEGDRHAIAIKRVLPKLAKDPTYLSMFEDEARLGMLLRHPNIVRAYDARMVGGTYLIVMELVDGAPLRALVDLAKNRRVGMPPMAALYIARELAKGLAYAHEASDSSGRSLGIIHRDVSPHNVLLGMNGAVKLADFGLAEASVHQADRSKELVGGKVGYLAPEVVLQKPPDRRIDIFAAGIVLWEMLAGRRLFEGANDADTLRLLVQCKFEPVSTIRPGIPPAVDAILARALARNPEDRFQAAGELAAELGEVILATDPNVGPRDIALMVQLFLANDGLRPPPPAAGAHELLAEELAAFARAARGNFTDLGASPLDPNDF